MPTGPLVLASGSQYRARVLTDAGYRIVTDQPDVDERALHHLFAQDPSALALRLAELKAGSVAPRHRSAVVLAGDQVGVLDLPDGPRQLTKMPDERSAVRQLVSMAGTTHRLVNGIVVSVTGPAGEIVTTVRGTDVQRVTMRPFTESEARSYVRRFRPFDSAGSYRLEDQELMGGHEAFVVDVSGEHPSGVLGLPLPLVERLLAEVGRV